MENFSVADFAGPCYKAAMPERPLDLIDPFDDTDDERADWARQWPNDTIPPKEKPPFNRDWRLPKGPF